MSRHQRMHCASFFVTRATTETVDRKEGKEEMDELVRLKRKLRQLKRLELRVRFGGAANGHPCLVWDSFFSTSKTTPGRFTLEQLVSMTEQEKKDIYAQFVYAVYYQQYRASGILADGIFDPLQLAEMGLPPDADQVSIHKRFRELAKRMHPDLGGSNEDMVRLLEQYNKLLNGKK